MKKIKAMNGYTIYKSCTDRDEKNYNCSIDSYNIYFSSDIRDFGITNSYPEFENVDTLEIAIEYCNNNYAIAREYCESKSTCVSFEEVEEIEKKLNAGMSVEELEELEELEEEIVVEDVKTEYQSIIIPGYLKRWSAFEKATVNNRTFYIMENDIYGDLTQYCVIEVKHNNIINVFDTYDDIITCLRDEDIIF